jgi:hypothetical protein
VSLAQLVGQLHYMQGAGIRTLIIPLIQLKGGISSHWTIRPK